MVMSVKVEMVKARVECTELVFRRGRPFWKHTVKSLRDGAELAAFSLWRPFIGKVVEVEVRSTGHCFLP